MKATELVRILETAYDVERQPKVWLREVTAVLAPELDVGLGVSSYFVDMSDPDAFVATDFTGTGMMGGRSGRARFDRWKREVPVAMQRHIHSFGGCGTAESIPPIDGESVIAKTTKAHRLPDMIGLNAIDASGRGCTFAAPLRRRQRPLSDRRRVPLERVAAHVATALRICRKLRHAEILSGEAILEQDGRIAHASGHARGRRAQEALRRAAAQIDRARTKQRRLSPEDVTELWQAIVGERWSVVDHFDRDGRRYFVAHANTPVIPEVRLLSEREALVVGGAALGQANGMIAYELGISKSSVATHLRRAAQKLGVRTRAELVSAFLELRRKA